MEPPPLRHPIRKKRSTRASNLTISLAPELAPPSCRSITSPVRRSPARPSPAQQSAPSSLVSPVRSTTIQQRNYSGPSPDFLAPPLSESLVSVEWIWGTPPLTPFPPFARWVSDDEDNSCDVRRWEESVQRSTSQMDNKQHSYDGRHVPVTIVRLEGRWIISSAIHGFVLVTQFAVSLGVFSALMWVTVWKEDEPGNDFTEWLWTFVDPILVTLLLLCSVTLLAHEVKLLSSVALLYLQSLILAVTTAASVVLWARCFQEQSPEVKGVLMGCNVMLWGLALFGFIRAAVVWKAELSEDGGMDVERGMAYGTFVPWGVGDERRGSL
ncbi:uncharacterized protein NECHADRAFT_77531 [Fusarium vanettenii 77-13-4]|uniref:Uncharacterized protein n=1 Tax=Fusarium vanettenii (strain ATCC MYA-4622 / CBS 123669 / FGSC 9596 / NRRL 45880 / 77-13-4) TaxID=660122 RepID=C7YLH3_FUSV7|nr:uncharacterized protein NECHADRAFT_77531 [Fusarium vanettenii 77-13-4]EEU47261.1 hypothetical protein NECHADRAFT_77531 [Fusarium vanettenii 77-13-4]